MEDYQARMIDEYKELAIRIDKLRFKIGFVNKTKDLDVAKNSDELCFRNPDYLTMMQVQYHAMCAYKAALRSRILMEGLALPHLEGIDD